MRSVRWPSDPDLGTTYYTVGLIRGGVAPNVDARRTPKPKSCSARSAATRPCAATGRLPWRRRSSAEELLDRPAGPPDDRAGLPTAVFNFTTDIPFLDRWGAPLLLGPGSITLAHTADEYVDIRELHEAVDRYVSLAQRLLAPGH